ncbi:MAG TPA: phospholipase D-like domain-containing protein, partial [Steroidobacteraceae bacterium]|nr:phospholipase D-like domain-containing protein [Steroidobacteraceae bacterium]
SRYEILAASGYLVPGPGTVELVRDFCAQGGRVALLTNSLASTDVPAVHAGYAKRRRELLEAGAELHEYQKFASTEPRQEIPSSGASLHSKTMVFDRQRAWIGSFNLDPRSVELNTEVAVLLDSSSFAAELARRLEHDMAPKRSWQVRLVREPGSSRTYLEWHGVREGERVTVDHEPDASLWQRAAVQFFRLIPGLDGLL